MTTVVMLYSCVISSINSSIRIEVFGSRPELGSSQKRYFGLSAMARAIATLFSFPHLVQQDLNSIHFLNSLAEDKN